MQFYSKIIVNCVQIFFSFDIRRSPRAFPFFTSSWSWCDIDAFSTVTTPFASYCRHSIAAGLTARAPACLPTNPITIEHFFFRLVSSCVRVFAPLLHVLENIHRHWIRFQANMHMHTQRIHSHTHSLKVSNFSDRNYSNRYIGINKFQWIPINIIA